MTKAPLKTIVLIGLSAAMIDSLHAPHSHADEDMTFLFMQEAQAAFDNGRFEDARELVDEALAFSPDNPAAQKLKIFIVFQQSDFTQTQKLAQPFLGDQFDCAVALISLRASLELADTPTAETLAANIQNNECEDILIQLADQPEPASGGLFKREAGISGLASLGIDYDDSVADDPDADVNTSSGIDDFRLSSMALVDYEHRLSPQFSAGAGLLGFSNNHFDDGRPFDVQLVRGELRVAHGAAASTTELAFRHDEVVFNERRTISENAVSLEHLRLLDAQTFVAGKIGAAHADFIRNPDQDANKWDAQVRARTAPEFLPEGGSVSATYRYRLNDTDHENEFGYHSHRAGLNLTIPLPPAGWSTLLGTSLEYRRYDLGDVDGRQRREELALDLSATLVKSVSDVIDLELSASRRKVNASISAFDDTQHIVGFRTIITF